MRITTCGLIIFFMIMGSYAHAQHVESYGALYSTSQAMPWLGIMMKEGGKNGSGVIVEDVSMGSPAEAAGINRGDIILKLNGGDIKGADEFVSGIRELKAGSKIFLTVNKRGKLEDIVLFLGTLPLETQKMATCECGGDGIKGNYGYKIEDNGFTQVYYAAIKELDLNSDQKKKADALFADYEKGVIRLKAEIDFAEVDLRQLLQEDAVNLDKVKAKINKIGEKTSEIRFFTIKSVEEFRKILTEEQLNKIKGMMPYGEWPVDGKTSGKRY